MYVPPNIAAPTATYAPVTVTSNPVALAQSQALTSVRQTEIALTGVGPSWVTGPLNARTQAGGTSRANTPQQSLSMPRPAYIAAQFLAQDLSPQEVANFFIPAAFSEPVVQQRAQATAAQQPPATAPNSTAANPPAAASVAQTSFIPVVTRNYGGSAYQASNQRNAELASPPEIDTTL